MKKLLLLFSLLLIGLHLSAQAKFAIKSGFGVPELINLTFSVSNNQLEMEAGAGFLNQGQHNVKNTSIFALFSLHILGESKFTNQRPWFLKTGISRNTYVEPNYQDSKFAALILRLGRDIYFNPKFGLELDVGIMYFLYEDIKTTCMECDDNYHEGLMPAGSAKLFLKL